MRIFKNAWFERFTRKNNIKDTELLQAISRADKGQIDADLGSGVIKQRIARTGQGKSGGYRTIIFFAKRTGHFLFMVLPKVTKKTSATMKKKSSNRLQNSYLIYRMRISLSKSKWEN